MKTPPPSAALDRRRALERVRALAGLSAALETLKLLPAIDVAVLAVEWIGLKTAVPIAWELFDAWRDEELSVRAVLSAPLRANWLSLVTRAFGGAKGLAALAADVGTDAEAAALPAPLDGFDVPPMLADAVLCLLAHRELRALAGPRPLPIGDSPGTVQP